MLEVNEYAVPAHKAKTKGEPNSKAQIASFSIEKQKEAHHRNIEANTIIDKKNIIVSFNIKLF